VNGSSPRARAPQRADSGDYGLGLDFGAYLTGSILTETIFSWPGIGRYVVNAISRRDLPAIQGSVLFLSTVFVVVNLITDLAYAKRIRG
jgi:ABC-type dipeptide/oligopeptide/nickel transport system permease component